MFDSNLVAKIPLDSTSKLGSKKFPIPFSIIFGDKDWAHMRDQGNSESLIKDNQFFIGRGKKPKKTTFSQYHRVPTSDHNMHFDNPQAFINIIINDLIPEA